MFIEDGLTEEQAKQALHSSPLKPQNSEKNKLLCPASSHQPLVTVVGEAHFSFTYPM